MRGSRALASLVALTVPLWIFGCADEEPVPTAPEVSPELPALSATAEAQADDLIPDQYLVVFRRDVADPPGLARRLAENHGIRLLHTYQHAIKGFAGSFPEAARDAVLDALGRNPNVAYIEQDRLWYVDTHERLTGRPWVVTPVLAPVPPKLKAPSGLTATPISETRIDIAWANNETGEITGTEIHRSLDGPAGAFAHLDDVADPATSYVDGSLAASTEACYKVRVYTETTNRKGKTRRSRSGFSNTDCATTPGGGDPPSPPAAPSALSATATSSSAIDLVWNDNSDNEDEFEIERCVGAACTNFAFLTTTPANDADHTDSGLTAETWYRYRVRARNADGTSDYSNEAEAQTDPAPDPGTCTDQGGHDDLASLWGLRKVKADQNPKWQAAKNGGDCAIQAHFYGLDSGVDSDHTDLNVVETMEFVGDGSGGEDGNGHGTHTAGTAAAIDGNGYGVVGIAPGAPIHGFKVCGNDGSCPLSAIVAGIDEITARAQSSPTPRIVANMSLGGGASETIDQAVRESVNAGVVYSVAAGNGWLGLCWIPWDAQTVSPARVGDDDINASGGSGGDTRQINGVITTTSSTENDTDADCNFGAPVTVAAPGVNIHSTWIDGWATASGTSMATPHSAGAALLYLQDQPTATPAEVEQAIVSALDPWTTNDLPNANGRLDASGL